LIALELTPAQRDAVQAAYDPCVAIVGGPGTGKTTALQERIGRARPLHPDAEFLIVNGASDVDRYAFSLLAQEGVEAHEIDDAQAMQQFIEACAPFLALEWEELLRDQIDPEVPGLLRPERFLASAFRLIRRLRDAGVSPRDFLSRALAGATEFYARPPNFADPSLLSATKATFHDSLHVDAAELARQHRRELDLAKILAKLYESYADAVERSGRMTGRDSVVAAIALLDAKSGVTARLRGRHRLAFVDEAQELTSAQLRLLGKIFGEALQGVTLCGDPSSVISTVRMACGNVVFAKASARYELHEELRFPHVEGRRAGTASEEAEIIAQQVQAWLNNGVAPGQIAVLFRSVRNVAPYENALLDRNIPALVFGDVNLFADRRALDALALLWNVYDPFRHEWLLRTLSNPVIGLSDASLIVLCSEPADPQRQLFAFDDEPAPTTRSSRWDPKRDLRLGWNFIRGEVDDALTPDAAQRVARFRALREGWVESMNTDSFASFARRVWREGLAHDGDPGSARARAQQAILRALLERLRDFFARNPQATVADLLQYAQERVESELEAADGLAQGDKIGFVQIRSVEAAVGLEFEHVIVAGARPGSFPLWYSPEAFLFSNRLGMIPKENVGDARASRTAKFSYYVYRSKAQQHYNDRERRAFGYALRRARSSVLVTASGTPTRGVTAPEFLEELR
jgi:superfamily I DNA/RNA helicase